MCDTDQDKDVCPVCGQEYDHKREEQKNTSTASLRADAAACKTSWFGKKRTVFVHLDAVQTSRVTHVQQSDDDSNSGLGALFS